MSVILNKVKNLLKGITLWALLVVGFEEILRYTQHDIERYTSSRGIASESGGDTPNGTCNSVAIYHFLWYCG